jgi:hypothetical protein
MNTYATKVEWRIPLWLLGLLDHVVVLFLVQRGAEFCQEKIHEATLVLCRKGSIRTCQR